MKPDRSARNNPGLIQRRQGIQVQESSHRAIVVIDRLQQDRTGLRQGFNLGRIIRVDQYILSKDSIFDSSGAGRQVIEIEFTPLDGRGFIDLAIRRISPDLDSGQVPHRAVTEVQGYPARNSSVNRIRLGLGGASEHAGIIKVELGSASTPRTIGAGPR